jgi:hypothetical protein
MTDIFTAVIFNGRSTVPDHAQAFSTLTAAKAYVVKATGTASDSTTAWEEWAEGKFLFGYGGFEDIEEPLAAVYGSVLDEGTQ